MGLVSILTWPVRTTVAVVAYLLHLPLVAVLLPYRVASFLLRVLYERVNSLVAWTERGIKSLRTWKPFCYLFPHTPMIATAAVIEEEIKRDDEEERRALRSPSPDSLDESQSIASLIQDLIKLSQPECKQQQPTDRRTQQEKVQSLIQELQELATEGISLEGETQEQDEGVSCMLKDLGVLETYLTQFLCEQEEQSSVLPDRTSSLETILEETTSKESSPLHPCSPVPHRMRSIPPAEGTIAEEERELLDSQNEISQTLLMLQKVTNSNELKETLQQLAEMHKHDEFETPPSSITPSPTLERRASPPSDRERRESLKTQLTDSQLEMDNLVDSLDRQQKFMSSQQELQNVMDSLTIHTTDSAVVSPAPPSQTTPRSRSLSQEKATPPDEQIYDSLSPNNAPVYAKLDKKPRPPSDPPVEEKIYDSIQPLSEAPLPPATDDTPPPIPMRRTSSDVSTDSCDNASPVLERKKGRRRDSSGDEETSCHHHHKHKRHHHRRHSSSSHHHCRHCDHHSSPDDRSSSSHRPRSRERHYHHHRHRSPSDESHDEECGRRCYRESSGYESHDIESPHLTRRRGRVCSDVGPESVSTPPTPKEGRRGLFGFFGKKSTSLTSLSSNKSDTAGDRVSVSSYKM